MRKILFIIFDGLGDRPSEKLSGMTPLQYAKKPFLDELASEASLGLLSPLPKDIYPTSEESHLALFGYHYQKDYPGRGVLEALGAGIGLKEGQIAFRANFGTVDEDLKLVDPRAGLITNTRALASACQGIEIESIKFRLYPILAHRAVLILEGDPVKEYLRLTRKSVITDTDPHKAGPRKLGVRVLKPTDLKKTKPGQIISQALEQYQVKTFEILQKHSVNKKRVRRGLLPANFILTRGGGNIVKVPSFKAKYGLSSCCIAGAPLYKGIARYLGMENIFAKGATGTLNTNIKSKVKTALGSLEKFDFVFLHFKGTDIAAEDYGDPKMKANFISKIDRELGSLRGAKEAIIVVTGDHTTVCELKDHAIDPVPLLIRGGRADLIKTFDERSCRRGRLGVLSGADLMPYLLKLRNQNV